MKKLVNARVAIVHDWLYCYGGAERVLEKIIELFPDADVFSLFECVPDSQREFLKDRNVRTSFLQNMPGIQKNHRKYLPIMPLAIEQLDFSGYDLVISSSYSVAKGVITGPNQLHVSYVHSPMRYAWDLQHEYLSQSGLTHGIKSWLARLLLHNMRLWDVRTANGVDVFLANSHFIARRIWKVYRRSASVVYPPVDITSFDWQREKEDFYVTGSRLVPYKRIDIVVQAFAAMPGRRLVVIGDGPELARLKRDCPPNVALLGYQPTHVLADHMKRARAFIFPAEEDFGIMPLEAQACGTPVIAYGRAGALETVRSIGQAAPTGLFFNRQTAEAVVEAVEHFEALGSRIRPEDCRSNAARFHPDVFRRQFLNAVETAYRDRCAEAAPGFHEPGDHAPASRTRQPEFAAE